MPASIRRDLGLPSDASPDARLVLLERFITLLRELGSSYVLMDRIDEATILSGRAELMRPFIEPLLERRLLQFEGLALKLFRPIELSRLYLQAGADELQRRRTSTRRTRSPSCAGVAMSWPRSRPAQSEEPGEPAPRDFGPADRGA